MKLYLLRHDETYLVFTSPPAVIEETWHWQKPWGEKTTGWFPYWTVYYQADGKTRAMEIEGFCQDQFEMTCPHLKLKNREWCEIALAEVL